MSYSKYPVVMTIIIHREWDGTGKQKERESSQGNIVMGNEVLTAAAAWMPLVVDPLLTGMTSHRSQRNKLGK